MHIAQKGEKGAVKPITRFIAKYDANGKRHDDFSITSSKKLIIVFIFDGEGESFLLGEQKTVENMIENPELGKKDSRELLIYEPNRPMGSFLLDSYNCVDSGAFSADSLRILDLVRGNNENTKYSVGKKDEVSTVNTLYERFLSGNLVEKVFLDYYYFIYCKERRDIFNNQGLSLKKGELIRKERYERLAQTLEDDFKLIGSNMMSQKDLRELKVKDRSAAIYSTDKTVLLCENWQQVYEGYINHLASCNMFLKKCKRCGELFFASNYRTQLDEECRVASNRENNQKCVEKQKENRIFKDYDTVYDLITNFMRSKKFQNAPPELKEELQELLDRTNTEKRSFLAEYRKIEKAEFLTNKDLAKVESRAKKSVLEISEKVNKLKAKIKGKRTV